MIDHKDRWRSDAMAHLAKADMPEQMKRVWANIHAERMAAREPVVLLQYRQHKTRSRKLHSDALYAASLALVAGMAIPFLAILWRVLTRSW